MRSSLPGAALVAALCLAALPALADRGALTLDVGGRLTLLALKAPFATPPSSVLGSSAGVLLGGRYALRNWLELSATGYFEPPVTYFHNGVVVPTANGSFPGTLRHQLLRYGATAGARLLWGSLWRLVAGLELGISHRAYEGFVHIDDTEPTNSMDYGLVLPSFTTDNLVLSPLVGLEFAGGDHWSISLLPRLEVLLGPDPTWALAVPLCFSWSWYL